MYYIKKKSTTLCLTSFRCTNVPYPEDLPVRQRALHIRGILFPKEGQNERAALEMKSHNKEITVTSLGIVVKGSTYRDFIYRKPSETPRTSTLTSLSSSDPGTLGTLQKPFELGYSQ